MRHVSVAVVVALVMSVPLAYGATVSGSVEDAKDAPVAGVDVTAQLIKPGTKLSVNVNAQTGVKVYKLRGPSAKTDAAGKFAIADLGQGTYALAAGPSAPMLLTVGKDDVDAGVIALPKLPGRVTGRVVVDGKKPAQGSVSLYLADYGIKRRRARVGDDGSFALAVPPATTGKIVLLFEASLPAAAEGEARAAGRALKRVAAPAPGGVLDLGEVGIVSAPMGVVKGEIVNAKARPVKEDYLVYAFNARKPLPLVVPATQSREGRFSLRLPAGRWRLVITRSGAAPITQDVSVKPELG